MNVFAEEAVGADDEVDAPGGEFGEGVFDFFSAPKATDLLNDNWIGSEAFFKGVEVLLAKDGGGDKDGGLFAGEDCFKNSAESDFSFSESDVTADQAIHRSFLFHLVFSGLDGAELVVGFGKGEGVFEFSLPEVVGGKGEAVAFFALGVELEELGCVIEGGHFGIAASFLP